VYCVAEVLEKLQSENKKLSCEQKKFRDIIENSGQYPVFFVNMPLYSKLSGYQSVLSINSKSIICSIHPPLF